MVSQVVRHLVLERDGYRCVRCGTEGTKSNPLQMHHIVFKCRGGPTIEGNLVTMCAKCHREYHAEVHMSPIPKKRRRKRR